MSEKDRFKTGQERSSLIDFENVAELAAAIPLPKVGDPITFTFDDLHGDILSTVYQEHLIRLMDMKANPSPSFTVIYGAKRSGKSSLMLSLQENLKEESLFIDGFRFYNKKKEEIDSFINSELKRNKISKERLKVIFIEEIEAIITSQERLNIIESLAEANYCVFATATFPNTHIVDEIANFSQTRGIDFKLPVLYQPNLIGSKQEG